MEIYLVGGAIRDELLGIPVKERDWVVVGSSPEALLQLGYLPVGKEFPVFLHPVTREEYALARTERKVGKGYKGFTFYTAQDVTLSEDLKRRDFTINAIARDQNGHLVDPYGGLQDLKQKVLRHVSPAFAEDPVRILRAARFCAKLPEFSIAEETLALMRAMVINGEVNALVAERVWQEWRRALGEPAPQRFFQVLEDCQALPIIFPELIDNKLGIDALRSALSQTDHPVIRFAVLVHALLPSQIDSLANRLKLPKVYTELGKLIAQYLTDYRQLNTHDAERLYQLIKKTDALRRPTRFFEFLQACELSSMFVQTASAPVFSIAQLQSLVENLRKLDVQPLLKQGLTGKAMALAIAKAQMQLISQWQKQHEPKR